MARTERLFLLDGMALAYRAYFSFISRPLINSKGENTSAVYGFVTALMRILEDEQPDHVAVVFDTKEPTFRHELYADYKATRQKMPEDMAAQLDRLKEVVHAFNTPIIEVPGFEADDVIGTLARKAEQLHVTTYLVTGDKDFMQLISPLIRIYKPGKSGGEVEIVDENGVREKFGVTPDRVIDVLGLIGDKSDNIPGVPGVGEKTAIPLIQKFGSIENLYDHVEEIPRKGLKEKLITNRDKALLSKKLVTIHTEVPLTIDVHQLRAAEWDRSKLLSLFTELEFPSLANRLRGSGPPAPREDQEGAEPAAATVDVLPADTTDISSDEHSYRCISDLNGLTEMCSVLQKSSQLAFDTETTSTDSLLARLVGLSFSVREREAYYVPVRTDGPEGSGGTGLFGEDRAAMQGHDHTRESLPLGIVLQHLKPILEDPSIQKIGQNAKYDLLVLRNHGINVQGVTFDTMVASYVLRPDGQHGLNALAMEWLRYRMISFADLVGKGKQQRPITEVPLEAITDYSAQDADITLRVFRRQVEVLERHSLLRLCREVEFPLMSVLARMEFEGVSLDEAYLSQMSKELERQLENLVGDIHRAAGEAFNINSTQQLADVLFNKLKLPAVKKTKTGYSTDVSVLEGLQGQHQIINLLLEYRQLSKLKSTYVDALPSLVNPSTGRLHTSFNQTIAATGRLSSSDPNLQNIPIRSEIGRAIRKAFIPRADDLVIMSADYSQIELRVMAHMSGDTGLLEAFRNGEDIHASTAAKVFGTRLADVSRDMRRKAKEVNFGIMYGIGPFGLANRLEISQTEARDIISRYFERFPNVKAYITATIENARRDGYVTTLLGRRRYLPDITSRNQNVRGNAERQAINMPIQGTAADMIKLAMIQLDAAIIERNLRSRMLLQVHDELVFEVPVSERAAVEQLVVDKMKHALALNVPIEVEVGVGRNWFEAH